MINNINHDPLELEIVNSMSTMTEYQKSKFVRLAIRLANKDAKALDMIDKYERGFISVHQLLGAM